MLLSALSLLAVCSTLIAFDVSVLTIAAAIGILLWIAFKAVWVKLPSMTRPHSGRSPQRIGVMPQIHFPKYHEAAETASTALGEAHCAIAGRLAKKCTQPVLIVDRSRSTAFWECRASPEMLTCVRSALGKAPDHRPTALGAYHGFSKRLRR